MKGPDSAHGIGVEGIIYVEILLAKARATRIIIIYPVQHVLSRDHIGWLYRKKLLSSAGYEIRVGEFPFHAPVKGQGSRRASDGLSAISMHKYGIAGRNAIGRNVTAEMIAEVVAARELETTGTTLLKPRTLTPP